MQVSIIIPVLNEEKSIRDTLERLQVFRKQGHEVIVVDGGSKDNTSLISSSLSDKLITAEPGRALQMNKGAAQASFDILWFLHADTLIPHNAIEKIQAALIIDENTWGRFNVRLSGSNWLFRIIETMMNVRSCLTGIATGDQAIFVKRKAFESLNGFANLPLMEDVNLSKRLKKQAKPVCVKDNVVTSSRRWEEKGILSTVWLMWRLRFLYWLGVSANKLSSQYR